MTMIYCGAHEFPHVVPLASQSAADHSKSFSSFRPRARARVLPPPRRQQLNRNAWKLKATIDSLSTAEEARLAFADAVGRLPGRRGTTHTPLLAPPDALARLRRPSPQQRIRAFFSSDLGGIVTDPSLALLPLEDRMAQAGHGVSDALVIVDGHLYQPEPHLRRFLHAALRANTALPRGLDPPQLLRSLLDTAAASALRNGVVRLWLSRGRGLGSGPFEWDYRGASREESADPPSDACLYIAVQEHGPLDMLDSAARPADRSQATMTEAMGYLKGWRLRTSHVPPLPPYFASFLHTSRLHAALALDDARARGADAAALLDASGCVQDAGDAAVAVVTRGGVVVIPPFAASRPSIAASRLLQLLPTEIAEGLPDVCGVEQRPLPLSEALEAREVFLVSTLLGVMPVHAWDGVVFGDGEAGRTALRARNMLFKDRQPCLGSTQHLGVPYGATTGQGL